ncbi:MAG TPA: hypothetical protein VMT30_03215 [Candidatus Saccharimonadia bacterium]|nr:hypothetical protein [Candidatus Saccharimonadia bacterium]
MFGLLKRVKGDRGSIAVTIVMGVLGGLGALALAAGMAWGLAAAASHRSADDRTAAGNGYAVTATTLSVSDKTLVLQNDVTVIRADALAAHYHFTDAYRRSAISLADSTKIVDSAGKPVRLADLLGRKVTVEGSVRLTGGKYIASADTITVGDPSTADAGT